MFLGELAKPVSLLKGAGKKITARLSVMGIETVADLLTLPPRGAEDRKKLCPLAFTDQEQPLLTLAEVVAHDFFGRPPKQTLKVIIRDETGPLSLLCFNRNFLAAKLPPGARILIYGQTQIRYGEKQSSLFEFQPVPRERALTSREDYGKQLPQALASRHFGAILPIYPLTEGIGQATMRGLISRAMESFGRYVEDELPAKAESVYPGDPATLETARALQMIHQPESVEEMEEGRKALAYTELFHLQFSIARRGELRKKSVRPSEELSTTLRGQLISALPFPLTADQSRSLEEIHSDLQKPYPMARLLQGDVGSGKTLTALLSTLPLIEAGHQVAFMAPTELLARQHAESSARFLSTFGIRLALLTGNVTGKAREQLLSHLEEGEIDLVIGTHSLFAEKVRFKDLRYCIIDEQQKFGVMQRLGLLAKGKTPDLLLMTATPIPRTMALTVFGDLSVSTIKTMPPGRLPVVTHLAKRENRYKVYGAVEKELSQGGKAYFVYPAIGEGRGQDIAGAEKMFDDLSRNVFGHRKLGLIHSKLPEERKELEMERFTNGETEILVATSVVEVGVDIPEATCMVIEQAERFGLSALHQLRGRVGRGSRQSWCFLIYSEELNETGKARMRIMKEESDGFKIADEDLKLRGPGELSGIRQSGVMKLRFANLLSDKELFNRARTCAFSIAEADPELLEPQHTKLRRLYHCSPPFEDLGEGA
jgi:ATP-dependent DNA helicase RecG